MTKLRTVRLEKVNENGNVQFWECTVNDTLITTEWGIIDGRIQEKEEEILEGKNIGRSNELTPEEVALDVFNRKARGKLDRGYEIVEGKIDPPKSKTARDTNYDIPKPMLANKFQDHQKKFSDDDTVAVQPKLDGNRCLVNVKTKKMYSRGRKEILSLPHIVDAVIKASSKVNTEWVDGELYSHDLSFNEMQSIIRKAKEIDKEKAKLIEYHCFDYMSSEDYVDRASTLANKFKDNEYAKLVQMETCKVKDLKKMHSKYTKDGYEGIMVRTLTGGYEQKRSRTLYKYKTFTDEEFKCVGFVLERGTSNKCGRITLVTENGDEFGARMACSDDEKVWMWKNQKKLLGKMVTVEFQEKSADNIPRFPIGKAFRDMAWDGEKLK